MYSSALQDFRRARSQAFLREIVSRYTGQSTELLSYEDVRQKLRAYASSDRGLQDIPLTSIVGSVGRYNDFTRDFLPRQDSDKERWARVKAIADGSRGFPPIDVYKMGDVYFVKDGNHRVSVARQLGAEFIQAYVTEVRTRVPLTPETQPDDLIVIAEYAEFLERTSLDKLYPDSNLSVTIPGQYAILLEHIAVHRHHMGNEQMRFISEQESGQDWYDTVYLPVVRSIRELGILRHFPGRTETDLYLWITEHRTSLEEEWDIEIPTEVAALDLSEQENADEESLISRIGGALLEFVSLGSLEVGPPPGKWRQEVSATHHDDRIFPDILVPVNGEESGWFALNQALVIAEKEGSRLFGFHLVLENEIESEIAQGVKLEFEQRCQERGIQGRLMIRSGEIARAIANEARLTDLVVTTLLYPPPTSLLARREWGFRELIRRCPRPILAVPQVVSPANHALLSYDGSPKADEALFIATYCATRWSIPLTVITVFGESDIPPETLLRAKIYLEEHEVEANLVAETGPVAATILKTVNSTQADIIIMGGYGLNPGLKSILGSKVDHVLREAKTPVLICR